MEILRVFSRLASLSERFREPYERTNRHRYTAHSQQKAGAAQLLFCDTEICLTSEQTVIIPFSTIGSKLRELVGENLLGVHWLHGDYEIAVEAAELEDWIF